MNEKVLHSQKSKNKYVYMYKQGGSVDMVYLKNFNGSVKYFNTEKQARQEGGNRPCWNISKIVNPLGI